MSIQFPNDFVFQVSIKEIINKLDLDPNKMIIEGIGPITRKIQKYSHTEKYPSRDGNRMEYEEVYLTVEIPSWWRSEGDFFVLCENTPTELILGDWGKTGIAGEMGLAPEKIEKCRQWLGEKEENDRKAYGQKVIREFITPIRSKPEFEIIPPSMKHKLQRMSIWDACYLSRIKEEFVHEWEKATESISAGTLRNVQVWKRTGGRTNAGNGWVIGPDGTDREPDSMWNEDPRRLSRYNEGYMLWEKVNPGELVLQWTKDSSAADHEFTVIHQPVEGLTEAQCQKVLELEVDIENAWRDARGFSSGEPSPSVGDGWNILPENWVEKRKELIRTEGDVEDDASDDFGCLGDAFDSLGL